MRLQTPLLIGSIAAALPADFHCDEASGGKPSHVSAASVTLFAITRCFRRHLRKIAFRGFSVRNARKLVMP